MDWNLSFAARARSLRPSDIREISKLAKQPGMISFAGGSPNPALFPYDTIARAAAAILSDPVQRIEALQYGNSEGYPPLREFIAQYLSDRGARICQDAVLITNGSQQALEFLGKLLLETGDRVIVTSPTYLGAMQAFNLFQPAYAAVPIRKSSIDLDVFERECTRGAKFIYLTPDFGNPSGLTLTLDERRRILELSRRFKIPIIEDQAYDQLWLSGEPQPPLLALDGEGLVIYTGTFSKSIVPGLRVGWIAGPQPVIEKLVPVKQASDLVSAPLNQMIVHCVADAALERGEEVRATYRSHRDAMLQALARYMPNGVEWNEPAGGMFVWITFPDNIDAAVLQERAAREERVLFVPGTGFHPDRSGHNTARLSFSMPDEDAIDEGIERLARVVEQSMRQIL